MESTSSSAGIHHPRLPPGFRFHPTDEELVVHYLKKKAASAPLPVAIMAELDLYKYDPWELPSKASFGEQEWYFFSPRERKYPNGERPNRAATSGYWKATGTDKPILTADGTRKIGVKKALVFYGGKPPKGVKTNWIMHEYRLVDNNSSTNKPPGSTLSKKGSLWLDDWVLCRIFKKINTSSSRPIDQKERDEYVEDGYEGHNIPGPGKPSCHGNFYSSGNGPAIPGDPMSISLLASSGSSKSDIDPKHIYSWNGTMFSNEQWGAGNDENNPGNSCPAEKNISFISLLNQQYPQEFHQNLLINSSGDHGILHQSYQLNSHFPASMNN